MTSRHDGPSGAPRSVIPQPIRAGIRRRLLRWYDRHKRDLPWRKRADDPYAQWVAEIMLQQTRVDTVVRYYGNFLHRFPNATALASARHETVLKAWEGLGYYRRALLLHRASKMLHAEGSCMPATAAELKRLPGIGDYTSAAIASIAFGERVAAVDGNVARVLARLFDVRDDILSPPGKAHIQALADQLIPRGRPGDFNQAWMDLGSAICTPRSPDCGRCPLASGCLAAATDRADELPVRGQGINRKPREMALVVGMFLSGSRIFVRRRPTGGLWSGLWEFPNEEWNGFAKAEHATGRLAERLGLQIADVPREVGTVRHRLTHRSLTFHICLATVKGKIRTTARDATACRWVTDEGFAKLSVSTAHRRVFAAARHALP